MSAHQFIQTLEELSKKSEGKDWYIVDAQNAYKANQLLANHRQQIINLVKAAEATREQFYKTDATPIKRAERDCLDDLTQALASFKDKP